MQDRLQLAIELARRAGGLLLEGQGTSLHVSKKGATDLVTDYDLKSERMLVKGIRSAYPDDAILAEEGTSSDSGYTEHLWLIDPLDGTTNYAHGVPFYSVSIGLMANERLLFGVVYDPNRDELFHASEGGGAWRLMSCCCFSSASCSSATTGGSHRGRSRSSTTRRS
ncbi:MAG: inositol monophosphatase family protein, partial [Anaerolineales bacterium]